VLNPNMSAKIVSPEGKEVRTGQTGELLMKGPNIFKGYLNNPEGTANAFDEEGYFKSGDVGYVDDKGNFYITDRLKELIKYKGFQVAPAELEGILLDHPEIDDVAVIGVYDADQATEVPRAYIVLKPGGKQGTDKEDEIAKWLTTRVANHKRLRGGVRFLKEIPRNASGKILRRMLTAKVKEDEEAKKAMKPKL
jgi:4-coumarate--CoA ligase